MEMKTSIICIILTPTNIMIALSLHDALPISSGYFLVMGMICSRRSASGALIEMARFGRRSSFARSSMPGMIPDVETVIRFRSEEHTSELQSRLHLVCRLLLEKKKQEPYEQYN